MLIRFAGIELGRDSAASSGAVLIESFDASYPEIRSSDAEREGRDGVMPGRDFFGVRTLSFDVVTDRRTMVEARETAAQLLTAWRDRSVRLESGAMVPLDVKAAGDPRWRRFYGRPRRGDDPDLGVVMRQGAARFTLEFDVMDARVYSGDSVGEHSVRIEQAEEFTAGGWTWPRDPGWPVLGQAVGGTRMGAITAEGTEPTPATITFHGPGTGFRLRGNRGWSVGLRPSLTLASDESITIDPMAGTVVDNFGRRRFGDLDRRSGLHGVVLNPGTENIFFTVTDETMSAYATVTWRDAYATLA